MKMVALQPSEVGGVAMAWSAVLELNSIQVSGGAGCDFISFILLFKSQHRSQSLKGQSPPPAEEPTAGSGLSRAPGLRRAPRATKTEEDTLLPGSHPSQPLTAFLPEL